MKNVLISDYDETFYIDEDDIKKNISALEKYRNKDNIFIIATGRSYENFKEHVKAHKFPYDYLILNHGATIVNSTGEMIYDSNIDDKIISDLVDDLHIDRSKKHFFCSQLINIDDIKNKNISKINVLYNSIEETIEINKLISKKYGQYISTYINRRNSLEIVSKDTNKATAIEYLLKKVKLLDANIYVIGDGYSDVRMVKEFRGFAIKNSIDEVKEWAKKEYNSVSELIYDILIS